MNNIDCVSFEQRIVNFRVRILRGEFTKDKLKLIIELIIDSAKSILKIKNMLKT